MASVACRRLSMVSGARLSALAAGARQARSRLGDLLGLAGPGLVLWGLQYHTQNRAPNGSPEASGLVSSPPPRAPCLSGATLGVPDPFAEGRTPPPVTHSAALCPACCLSPKALSCILFQICSPGGSPRAGKETKPLLPAAARMLGAWSLLLILLLEAGVEGRADYHPGVGQKETAGQSQALTGRLRPKKERLGQRWVMVANLSSHCPLSVHPTGVFA